VIHEAPHPKAGKDVHINVDPGGILIFTIEDWWDRVGGESWMFCDGNPACLAYAIRSGSKELPMDDEVVYGKVGHRGVLVHVSEIQEDGAP